MRALKAGKHVIEEKPVAETVEEAISSIKEYRSSQLTQQSVGGACLWMLAENYRYEQVPNGWLFIHVAFPVWMPVHSYVFSLGLSTSHDAWQVFHEAVAVAPWLLGTPIKLDLVVNLPMDVNNK